MVRQTGGWTPCSLLKVTMQSSTCVPGSCGMALRDNTPWAQANTVALQHRFMTFREAGKLTAHALCRLATGFWQVRR